MSNFNWVEADRLCQLKHSPKMPQFIRFYNWCCAEINGGWNPHRDWNITEVRASLVAQVTTAELAIYHSAGGKEYYIVHSLKDIGDILFREGKPYSADLALQIVEESRENQP